MFSLWRDGCEEGRRLGSFENCLSARLSRNKDVGLAEPLNVSPNIRLPLDSPTPVCPLTRRLLLVSHGMASAIATAAAMAMLDPRAGVGRRGRQSCLPGADKAGRSEVG